MSIHDFHSKLASGKEEGGFIEALRRLRGAGSLAAVLADMEPAVWSVWTEAPEEGGCPRAANA